jgi:hypothetical protein
MNLKPDIKLFLSLIKERAACKKKIRMNKEQLLMDTSMRKVYIDLESKMI